MKFNCHDVAKLGTILGIWAHPDDEVFASGGLIASAVENGQEVILITATKGDSGNTSDESKWPMARLSEIREKELDNSLKILGLDSHHWLDYKDGQLDGVDSQEAVNEILKMIGNSNVDTVVSFEPDGITGHPDHKAVSRWSKIVSQKLGCDLLQACENKEFYDSHGKNLDEKYDIYFNIDKPKLVSCDEADFCLCLEDELKDKKYRAIAEHKSQTLLLLSSSEGSSAVKAMCKFECFIRS